MHQSPFAPMAGPQQSPTSDIGPWKADQHQGYSSTYWVVSRRNRKWMGGTQTLMTRTANPRRFGSQKAAQAMADKLNDER